VDFALHRLERSHVGGVLRQERIEHRLVLARDIEPALDADPVHQLRTNPKVPPTTPIEPTIEDASQMISSAAQATIAAGRGDVLGEGDHRAVVLGGKLADAAIDQGAIAPAIRRAN
jgi:hypothetical protein